MKQLLVVLTALMFWGPPRLRVDQRPLGIALENPFDLDGSAFFQVAVWILSALVVAFILGGRGLFGRHFLPKVVWRSSLRLYLAYGLLALASATYSVSPFYTLFFAGKILTSLLAVALLTDRSDLSRPAPMVFTVYMAVSIVQWLLNASFLLIDPKLVGTELPNIGYRLAGGIFEDYGTPTAMASLFFLSAALFSSRQMVRIGSWGLFTLTWVFLGLSRTRSSIIGALAMLLVMLTLHRRSYSRVVAFLIIGLVCLGLIATQMVDSLVVFGMRGQSFESLLTFTGRTQAFEFLVNQWKDSPWLGLGYGAGTRFLLIRFVRETGLGIGSAHDAVSKVLVDLGLLGAVVLGLVFVLTWMEMIRLVRIVRPYPELQPLAMQLFAVFVYYALTNVVAGGIAEVPGPLLVVSVCAAVVRRRIAMEVTGQRRVLRLEGLPLTPCPSN
ncbi:MAG: O-antigen ligase family protein [Acidobacteriia bacterium]|nr:O-antigen ligase family protein [Terriglobia bacterium]